MKGTTEKLLFCSSVVAVLTGLAGVGAAAPMKPKRAGASPSPMGDSVQVTVTSSKGRLGIEVLQISSELRVVYGASADRGVLVNAVRPDSPAARAGVKVGDVIVEVDGDATESAADMLDAMSDRKRADVVPLVVVRNHKRTELRATLDDDPIPEMFGTGGFDAMPQNLEQWFPDFRNGKGFGFGDSQRLNEVLKRLEQLERRIDHLERT